MFQRAILRQTQAVKSVLSSSYTSTAPLAARRSTRFQPQLSQPLVRQPAFRFYSTENKSGNGEQKEAEKENGKENGAENKETPEDPLRKELEEKKKEVTDLKVASAIERIDTWP